MSKLTKDEAKYYVDMLEQARDIVLSLPGGAGATTELIAVVFEKIASPLVYLRQDIAKEKEALQGGFSHETPGVNDEKMPSKENENEGDATIGHERKARLLKEGWEEVPKYPDILYKTVGYLTFFEDTRDGRSWIRRHRGGEE